MDTTLLIQQILNGLVNGMSYVLIATGLTLVFGVLRIINFAHGEFYMLGALLTYYVGKLVGLDYLSSTVAATVLVAGLGVVANRLFFWPLRREHEFTILLASLGLSLFIVNGSELLFGSDPKYVDSPFADETLEFGQIVVTQQRVLIFGVAALAIAALYAFLRFSRLGKMMRDGSSLRPRAALPMRPAELS